MDAPRCGCCARRRLLTSFNTRAAAARTPGSAHSPAGRVIRTTKALTRGGPPARRIRTVIKNARTILSLPPPPLCSATAAPPFGIRGAPPRSLRALARPPDLPRAQNRSAPGARGKSRRWSPRAARARAASTQGLPPLLLLFPARSALSPTFPPSAPAPHEVTAQGPVARTHLQAPAPSQHLSPDTVVSRNHRLAAAPSPARAPVPLPAFFHPSRHWLRLFHLSKPDYLKEKKKGKARSSPRRISHSGRWMLVLKEMALSSTSTFGKRAKLKETAACSRSDIWTLSGAGAAGASGPGAPPATVSRPAALLLLRHPPCARTPFALAARLLSVVAPPLLPCSAAASRLPRHGLFTARHRPSSPFPAVVHSAQEKRGKERKRQHKGGVSRGDRGGLRTRSSAPERSAAGPRRPGWMELGRGLAGSSKAGGRAQDAAFRRAALTRCPNLPGLQSVAIDLERRWLPARPGRLGVWQRMWD
ncbi:uncharacterized protein LOC131812129 [Mustela lutreola]|uniref:uncharacterized protein LOC131812129 n=1 Tax=Mustela lutreola TaxID=9666 RepID=UPI0027975EC4|nr:uncharacterized protein LOC131812129 [Mustela lutreola]